MELEVSCAWYAQALGASRVARFDHHDSSGRLVVVVLEVPGLGTLLQLRCDVDPGLDVRGFPPITFQVDDPAHLGHGWGTSTRSGSSTHRSSSATSAPLIPRDPVDGRDSR